MWRAHQGQRQGVNIHETWGTNHGGKNIFAVPPVRSPTPSTHKMGTLIPSRYQNHICRCFKCRPDPHLLLFWGLSKIRREKSYTHLLTYTQGSAWVRVWGSGLFAGTTSQPDFMSFLSWVPLPSQVMLLLPLDSAIIQAQDLRRPQLQCYLIPLILGRFSWQAPSGKPYSGMQALK